MVETYRHLSACLGPDLGYLAYSYTAPENMHPIALGASGLRELCDSLPDDHSEADKDYILNTPLICAIAGASMAGCFAIVDDLLKKVKSFERMKIIFIVELLAKHDGCIPTISALLRTSKYHVGSRSGDANTLIFIGLLHNNIPFAKTFYNKSHPMMDDVIGIMQNWEPSLSDAQIGAIIKRMRGLK